jgi:cell division protein FtsI/penicillin-binding protein 2
MTRRSLIAALGGFAMRDASLDWIGVELSNGASSPHWNSAETPVNMGSLLKPFLVLAYSATHDRFPQVECRGFESRCWSAHAHGRQNVIGALANSCNAYFLALSAALDRAALDQVALEYGLRNPTRSLTADRLIGLNAGWPQVPLDVVNAFSTLARNRNLPAVGIALAGMARCAQSGTARATGFNCYAKTGTAPCTHLKQGSGDGFAVTLFPLHEPRYLILARRHNRTGAETARDLGPLASHFA